MTSTAETVVRLDGNRYALSLVGIPDVVPPGTLPIVEVDLVGGRTPEALFELLRQCADVQADQADERRRQLVGVLMGTSIDPVPMSTLGQARRLARHRNDLLRSGAHTIASLAELRGDDPAGSTTRTWLTRQRQQHRLFSVRHHGKTLVPAFQLDSATEPREQLRRILLALDEAGVSGWETWTWFTTTSNWLSGERPIDVIERQPGRVAVAAERFASNAASPVA